MIPNSARLCQRSYLTSKRYYATFQNSKHLTFDQRQLSSSAATLSECPYSKNNKEQFASVSPKLKHIPKLPLVGSMVPPHSGISQINLSNPYPYYPSLRKKMGDFYSIGIPGLGKGLYQELHVLTDPNEMLKVLRKEGIHPSGGIMHDWPLFQILKEENNPFLGFFGRGEEWLRYRRFFQTDLLTPSSAKGYVPGMIAAAEIASQGAPSHSSEMNKYLNHVSFDLFSSLMFGEFTKVAVDKNRKEKDKLNLEFCEVTVNSLQKVFPLMIKEFYLPLFLKFGIKSKLYKAFEKDFARYREIAFEKFHNFAKKKEDGLLNEFELSSYCARALDRMEETKGEQKIEKADVGEMVIMGLGAALDTTSSVLSWALIHLAMSPHAQQKAYDELQSNLAKSENGKLSEQLLTKSAAPYLHAILRESHRISPAFTGVINRDNATGDIVIHGERFPKGSAAFFLDSYSVGMDPDIIPDVDTFRPERWTEKEILSRKGTPAEVLDHPLYRDPFSAGARKCPGSRVANYEILVMLSQLIKDWKFSIVDDKIKSWRDVECEMALTIMPTVPEFVFDSRN